MSLTRDTWQRIETVLHEALDLPPARRAGYLDRACGGDAGLRSEVEGLIACADTDPGRFEKPVALRATGELPKATADRAAGERLGAWRIERLLGRGGMGEVYLAARADGQYQQQVAVKLMRPEAVEHLDRFHAERQILARLEHPGIARLLDSGVAPGERPYILMEYVAGQPLGEYCAGRRLPLRARIELFLQVCEAVSYAHAHLIVHRDLKPGNILVTADGRAKLLDFGIAKVLSSDWAGGDATVTRAAPLTPGHAAPEQLQGEPVSTATDVYALGTVLYELLAGRGPWELRALPVSMALHKLLHEDAPPASRIAAENPEAPLEARQLQGDLDAILAKALRKDPAARYATVNALRNDLQRYLDGEPVSAGPDSAWYRARKFVRRHYVAVGVAAAMVAVVAVFVWRLAVERDRALEAVATSQAVSAFLSQDMFAQIGSDQRPLRDLTVKEVMDASAEKVEKRFAGKPLAAAEVHVALGASYVAMDDAAAAEKQLDEALALVKAANAEGSEIAVDAAARMIVIKNAVGRLEQSFPHYEEIYRHGRDALGAAHPKVMKLSQQLALGYHYMARWQEAVAQFRGLIATARRMPNPDLKFIGATEVLLSRSLLLLGDFREVEALLRGTLAELIPVVGENHLLVAQARNLLGEALTELGRYREAEQELAQAAVIVREWAPSQQAGYVIRIRNAQARLLLEQNRLPEAAAILEALLQETLASAGPEVDRTVIYRRPLAEILVRQGRLDEAESQIRLALRSAELSEGRDDPLTTRTRIELADILRLQGRPAEARSMLQAVDASTWSRLPKGHPIIGERRRLEGLLWAGEKNLAAARTALANAIEICRDHYGAGHWRTRRAERELALAAGG